MSTAAPRIVMLTHYYAEHRGGIEIVAGALGDEFVRRGVDILKARALGAEAVLIGRPALYGACAAGEAGVQHALEILREELVRSMRLCGATHIGAITEDLLSMPA